MWHAVCAHRQLNGERGRQDLPKRSDPGPAGAPSLAEASGRKRRKRRRNLKRKVMRKMASALGWSWLQASCVRLGLLHRPSCERHCLCKLGRKLPPLWMYFSSHFPWKGNVSLEGNVNCTENSLHCGCTFHPTFPGRGMFPWRGM